MEFKVNHLDKHRLHEVIGPDVHIGKLAPAPVGEVEVIIHFSGRAHTHDEKPKSITSAKNQKGGDLPLNIIAGDGEVWVLHREPVDHDQCRDKAGVGLS